MSRTVIDLDDETLADAARHLGTVTKKDTVNAALREVADRRKRAEAVARVRQMVAAGEIGLDAIEEPDDLGTVAPGTVATGPSAAENRDRDSGGEGPQHHQDADFEAIARVTGRPLRRIVG